MAALVQTQSRSHEQ